MFATYGIPDTVVSDNGSCMCADLEFTRFLQRNGICYAMSVPYHPASDGLTERAVQTLTSGTSRQLQWAH